MSKYIWVTNTHKKQITPWIRNGWITGEPKASEKYTVQQMEELGMVGVYKLEGTNPIAPTKSQLEPFQFL